MTSSSEVPPPPPCPPPSLPAWVTLVCKEGEIPYYYNKKTGKSSWDRPVEEPEHEEGGGHITSTTVDEDDPITSGAVAGTSSDSGDKKEHQFMKHTNWANEEETSHIKDRDLSGKSVIGFKSCNMLLVQPSIKEPPVKLILLNTMLPEAPKDKVLIEPLMDIWDTIVHTYSIKNIEILFVKKKPSSPMNEGQKQHLERLEQDPYTGLATYFGLVLIKDGRKQEKLDLRYWLLADGLVLLHDAYKSEQNSNRLKKSMSGSVVNSHQYMEIVKDNVAFFKSFKNQKFNMKVLSVNTVVDYTISVKVRKQGSVDTVYCVNVKPIGLLSLTTREGMSLYDTNEPENDSRMNRMDSLSIQIVMNARKKVNERLINLKGHVSFEALGIDSNNTNGNLQVMLWDDKGWNLLSWMLEAGIAGLVGGSNYMDPDRLVKLDRVRCLCPYEWSVSDDKKEYKKFQYSPLEWTLVESERKAIVNKNGMWAAAKDDFKLPAISRVGKGKRHIFIDNSNLWIRQKKLSGIVQEKNDVFREIDMKMSSGQCSIDDQHFSSVEWKNFKISYYTQDRRCRTHFKQLGDLLGFKKGHDPPPQIFGSVPPDHDKVWFKYEETFGPKGDCVHLTSRTKDGKASQEDQDLIRKMCLTSYNKEDDLVLVAGDVGYRKAVQDLMTKVAMVYVVSWGNCSIKLKHLRNVVFVNLDPYLKYLYLSSFQNITEGKEERMDDDEDEYD